MEIGSSIQASLVFWRGIVLERLSFLGARFTVFCLVVADWSWVVVAPVARAGGWPIGDRGFMNFVLDWWGYALWIFL